MKYEPTLGLEIHVELDTESKMFCACKNDSLEKRANYNICPICTAQPGSLPVINKQALEKVIKVGLALNCEINQQSYFDRKNYFYPDLPKGYQISQKYAPLCRNGYLEIKGKKKIRIHEIHLEEDTCRLSHSTSGKDSYIDCNRAGVPLMELVTEPDLKTAQQAKEFAKKLQRILRDLGVSTADMEKGQMRIEVNISLSKNKNKLGTKVELKNINSFKAVEKATEYEIRRQKKTLEHGGEVVQQTRGWDADKGITILQREKETAHDYRYFPEPDLPLIEIEDTYIQKIRDEMPKELSEQKEDRYVELGVSGEQARILTSDPILVGNPELQKYFEDMILAKPNLAREIANPFINERFYETADKTLKQGISLPDPKDIAEFIEGYVDGNVSSTVFKSLLKESFQTGKSPIKTMEVRGLFQTSDESEIEKIVEQVIAGNEKAVSDFKAGKQSALQFLVGKVMAQSRGKANPEISQKLLKKHLS